MKRTLRRTDGEASLHRAGAGVLSTMRDVPRSRTQLPAPAESQSGATRRRHAAQHPCPDPGGRRFRQDAGADDPHRLAAADRPGLARRHPGRDLHQQGRQGNDDAPVGHAAGECARHVDRHFSRPVQPVSACALQAGQPAAELPDPGYARPAFGDQAPVQAVQHRRRTFPAQTD